MSEKKQLAILGGDERQIFAARTLAQNGFSVTLWGFGEQQVSGSSVLCTDGWQAATATADAVILPLPVSFDALHLQCPACTGSPLRLTAIVDQMEQGVLLGGKIPFSLRAYAEKKGILCIDYFDSEELLMRNAIPTAEGAIGIAMRELPVMLFGTSAAVIGYGRIGSMLAQRLKALGMRVTVYARRKDVLVLAELQGMIPCLLAEGEMPSALTSLPRDCRVLFNTVPSRLLDRDVLAHIPRECVLIDLASAPGGIDQRAAEEMGFRSIWGTALPGKCTPESAGGILGQTLSQMLSELL